MTENLTIETFKEKVFDFENSSEFKLEGDLPVIIDFYADWCGPCKMIGPVLEQLSNEYEGKLKIYKIDTEAEQELSAMFGIRSIPSLLFCPVNEDPQMANGALPKPQLEQIIKEVLKVEK